MITVGRVAASAPSQRPTARPGASGRRMSPPRRKRFCIEVTINEADFDRARGSRCPLLPRIARGGHDANGADVRHEAHRDDLHRVPAMERFRRTARVGDLEGEDRDVTQPIDDPLSTTRGPPRPRFSLHLEEACCFVDPMGFRVGRAAALPIGCMMKIALQVEPYSRPSLTRSVRAQPDGPVRSRRRFADRNGARRRRPSPLRRRRRGRGPRLRPLRRRSDVVGDHHPVLANENGTA